MLRRPSSARARFVLDSEISVTAADVAVGVVGRMNQPTSFACSVACSPSNFPMVRHEPPFLLLVAWRRHAHWFSRAPSPSLP